MNDNDDKIVVVRHKMIWSHARGDLNPSNSTIKKAAMPPILAWICNGTDDANAHHMQYHDPPLPMARFNTTRIDYLYCILWSRPEVCEHAGDDDIEKCQGKQGAYETNGKRKADVYIVMC